MCSGRPGRGGSFARGLGRRREVPMSSSEMYTSQYREKLTSPEAAVEPVKEGSLLIYGAGLAEPPALLWAFSNRLRAGDLKKLRVLGSVDLPHAVESVVARDLCHYVLR